MCSSWYNNRVTWQHARYNNENRAQYFRCIWSLSVPVSYLHNLEHKSHINCPVFQPRPPPLSQCLYSACFPTYRTGAVPVYLPSQKQRKFPGVSSSQRPLFLQGFPPLRLQGEPENKHDSTLESMSQVGCKNTNTGHKTGRKIPEFRMWSYGIHHGHEHGRTCCVLL